MEAAAWLLKSNHLTLDANHGTGILKLVCPALKILSLIKMMPVCLSVICVKKVTLKLDCVLPALRVTTLLQALAWSLHPTALFQLCWGARLGTGTTINA